MAYIDAIKTAKMYLDVFILLGSFNSFNYFFFFLEGENLLRDLEILRDRAEYFARQNRHINSLDGVGFGQSKRFDTLR